MIREILTSQLLLIGVFGAAGWPWPKVVFSKSYIKHVYRDSNPRKAFIKSIMFHSEDRNHWMYDQIAKRIERLKKNPDKTCRIFKPRNSKLPYDVEAALGRYVDYIIGSIMESEQSQERTETIETHAIKIMNDLAHKKSFKNLKRFALTVRGEVLQLLKHLRPDGKEAASEVVFLEDAGGAAAVAAPRPAPSSPRRPPSPKPIEKLASDADLNSVGDQKEDSEHHIKLNRELHMKRELRKYYDYVCEAKQCKDDPDYGVENLLLTITYHHGVSACAHSLKSVIKNVKSKLETDGNQIRYLTSMAKEDAAKLAHDDFTRVLGTILWPSEDEKVEGVGDEKMEEAGDAAVAAPRPAPSSPRRPPSPKPIKKLASANDQLREYYDYVCKDQRCKDDPENGAKALLETIEEYFQHHDRNVLEIINSVKRYLEKPANKGVYTSDAATAAKQACHAFTNALIDKQIEKI